MASSPTRSREGLISPAVFRWMTAGEWRAHPARAIAAAAAIAIGVALGFAVHLINASALSEFSRAVAAVSGEADLQVRSATAQGFDEGLYPKLARLEGISVASPAVELSGVLPGGQAVTVLGLDVLRAVRATPSLIGEPARGGEGGLGADALLAGESLFLSPSALTAAGARPGDTVALGVGGRSASFVVGGTLPGAAEGRRIAMMDIAAAQWRFGVVGRLQRIDLKLADGVNVDEARRRVAAALPPGVQLVSPETEAKRTDNLSRAYRVNLDMLALVALMTGGFLVFSAQSLAVARRRTHFALLRVLGATRRELLIQVFAEGLALGLVGAGLGLLIGLGFAAGALALLGGDLGGGYFSGARPKLVFAPGAAASFLALGVGAALAGSLLPAREAAEAPPAASLKNLGDGIDPRRRPAVWPALILIAAGGLAALAPAVGELPLFGYLAVALLLAGGVAAMPWLARIVLWPLQRAPGRSVPLDLAVKRLWGAPSQAGVALCGMVASTGLMIAMAVMVASFRGSVDDWLNQVIPPGLALRSPPGAGPAFDPETQDRMTTAPGVKRIIFQRTLELDLDPERPPIVLLARRSPGETLPVTGARPTVPAGETGAWVSEPAAWIYGWKPGARITLPIAPGGPPARLFVAGIWRDYARQQGAIALDDPDFTRLTGEAARSDASVELEPGARPAEVEAALRAALPAGVRDGVSIGDTARVRRTALRIFDRSFAITYLLEAVAIIVGVAGVAATISAQTLARTKEFGMLRHLGVRRSEIAGMLTLEGLLLGVLGALAGVGLGVVISQVLIQVINPQSFHWTMETRLPLGLLLGVAAALVAAAGAAALAAGRRALSADAVRAVREDW